MALIKMKALTDFEDQEGDVKEGDEILVNQERANALTATGRAERCADQSVEVAVDEGAGEEPPHGSRRYRVPKKPDDVDP